MILISEKCQGPTYSVDFYSNMPKQELKVSHCSDNFAWIWALPCAHPCWWKAANKAVRGCHGGMFAHLCQESYSRFMLMAFSLQDPLRGTCVFPGLRLPPYNFSLYYHHRQTRGGGCLTRDPSPRDCSQHQNVHKRLMSQILYFAHFCCLNFFDKFGNLSYLHEHPQKFFIMLQTHLTISFTIFILLWNI